VQQPTPSLPPPPGWYPDPTGPGLRWWDGYRWTEHAQAATPPAAPTTAAMAPGMAPSPSLPEIPQQKWWHIPLLVVLGVGSTIGWIVLNFLG
jgi:Protein of unknown function (DUF2510)